MSEETKWPERVSRTDAPAYLLEKHGIQRTSGTLAKLACLGGGPAFRKVNKRAVVYETSELDRWAEELLGPVQTSTSAAA